MFREIKAIIQMEKRKPGRPGKNNLPENVYCLKLQYSIDEGAVQQANLSSSKKRPVLGISNSEYNGKTEDIIVAAVTSNIEEKDYSVVFKNSDMLEGNIKVDSCVRADKIYTQGIARTNVSIEWFSSFRTTTKISFDVTKAEHVYN
jgi:mRNA-degrading endonuclease toxin of MazEF toxin-antitoxin module